MTFSYQPSFSPYISYFKAKNRKDALRKLIKLWPEYQPNIVKQWLHYSYIKD